MGGFFLDWTALTCNIGGRLILDVSSLSSPVSLLHLGLWDPPFAVLQLHHFGWEKPFFSRSVRMFLTGLELPRFIFVERVQNGCFFF